MNVICLVGRIIADPELRETTNGTKVCSFTISVNRAGGAKDENGYPKNDLIRCEAWRQTAEFISRYFSKGSYIGINGSLQVDNYTDKNGNKATSTKVVVNNSYFTGSKDGSSYSTAVRDSFQAGNVQEFRTVDTTEGDLPF